MLFVVESGLILISLRRGTALLLAVSVCPICNMYSHFYRDVLFYHFQVDLEDYVNRPDKISAAEISSICQEAGMQAVRKNRYIVIMSVEMLIFLYACFLPFAGCLCVSPVPF